jgi:hypothetical protein
MAGFALAAGALQYGGAYPQPVPRVRS